MKLRRSALESFDGCPHRFNVLYNLCLCGHTRQDHTDGTGECCGQVKRKGLVAVDAGPLPRHVPCDCEAFRPVEDKGDESQRGIAFHEIAFRYIDRLARLGLEADAEEAALAYQEGIALSQLAPHLLKDVNRLWERFSVNFKLNPRAYLTAEERQETDRFTWIPDLVYVYPNRVTIKDWKTYYKGLTPDQARSEFQLKFYLLQAKDIWPGFEEYEFVFVFVRLGYEVSVVLRPDDIEAFRPEVEAITLAMAEAARTGNFPAIQGSHCGLCRLKCPLADNPMKLPARFQTTEQAQQAFGRLLTLEQEVKALKKGLAAWCMTEGPLHYRGQEYLHKSSTSRRYPAAAVIDFLRERGTDKSLIEAITISHSALGDFGKPKRSSPAILEHLADIEQATTKWAFRHRKAGELAPAGYVDALEGDDDDSDE
jgi:hypothetical protein